MGWEFMFAPSAFGGPSDTFSAAAIDLSPLPLFIRQPGKSSRMPEGTERTLTGRSRA
jgi:hypothetical protein